MNKITYYSFDSIIYYFLAKEVLVAFLSVATAMHKRLGSALEKMH